MNSGVFDTVTLAFLVALKSGHLALRTYSLPLLGVFSVLLFHTTLWPLLARGAATLGDVVGEFLFMILKIGFFFWFVLHFYNIAIAGFATFAQWGANASGGHFSAEDFQRPSHMIDKGFVAARPLEEFAKKLPWSGILTALVFKLAFVVVVLAFAFIGLHLIVTLIEFHLAVMVSAVLLPWGILKPVAFFAEFSIGWVCGGLVRVLITAAVMSIAVPLFTLVKVHTNAGGDPTLYSAVLMGVIACFFAWVSWQAAKKATMVAGRGMALGLGSEGFATGMRGVQGMIVSGARAGVNAIRGTSRTLAAQRG